MSPSLKHYKTTEVSHHFWILFFIPPSETELNSWIFFSFTWKVKIPFFLATWDLGQFIVFQARDNNLLPWKNLALGSSMVKYGSGNKILAHNSGFSNAFLAFSCILTFERRLSAGNTNSLIFFLIDKLKMSQSQWKNETLFGSLNFLKVY